MSGREDEEEEGSRSGEKGLGMGRRERGGDTKRGFREEECIRRSVGCGIGNADYGGHSISPLFTPDQAMALGGWALQHAHFTSSHRVCKRARTCSNS
jgi:hypothetical protein